MEVDIIVVIGIITVVLFLIGHVSKIIRSGATHKTLRSAIEKDQPLTPELIDQLERAPDRGSIDERIGFVLVAIALALFAAGLINAGENNGRQLATLAMFPLLVGGALLLRLRLAARHQVEP